MKKIKILIILLMLGKIAFAQEPIKWTFNAQKIDKNVYELQMSAKIEKGWFIYSQFNPKMGGPTPTTFKFTDNPDVTINNEKLKEDGKLEEKYDSAFGKELKYYRDKVSFTKRISLINKSNTTINGTVIFMGCNSEMCLPPVEVEFKIELK